MEKDKVQ
jgi:ammonium transporter Rh